MNIKLKKIGSISLISFLLVIISFLFIAFEIVGGRTFVDEIMAIVSIIYLAYAFFAKKIDEYDKKCLLFFLIFFILGFISSFVARLYQSLFSVFIDMISNCKLFACFFALKVIMNNKKISEDYFSIMKPIAKLFLWVSILLAFVSIFFDIGMSPSERFGLRSFAFVFEHEFQMAACIFLASSCILYKYNNKTDFKYIILTIILLFINLKGPALICAALIVFLVLYYKKHAKLNVLSLVCIGVIVCLLGAYQISKYLLNENSPRYLFLKYSFITANNYFPLGSGYATFGSDMASRYYSVLYDQYGFTNLFGMNRTDGSFLSDNGWSSFMAQNGYVGFVFLIISYIYIFNMKNRYNLNNVQKALFTAIYFQYIIHALGSAILTSSSGIIGFCSLVLILKSANFNDYEKR